MFNLFKLIYDYDIRAILRVADLENATKFMMISLAEKVDDQVRTFNDEFAEILADDFNSDFSGNIVFKRYYVKHPLVEDAVFEVTCCSFDKESYLAILKARYGIKYAEEQYEDYSFIAGVINKFTDNERGSYQLIGSLDEVSKDPIVLDYMLKAVEDLAKPAVLKVEDLGESVGYFLVTPTEINAEDAQLTIDEYLREINFTGINNPNEDIYTTKLVKAGSDSNYAVCIHYDIASKADYARMLAYKKGILFSEGMKDMSYGEIINLVNGIVSVEQGVEGF